MLFMLSMVHIHYQYQKILVCDNSLSKYIFWVHCSYFYVNYDGSDILYNQQYIQQAIYLYNQQQTLIFKKHQQWIRIKQILFSYQYLIVQYV